MLLGRAPAGEAVAGGVPLGRTLDEVAGVAGALEIGEPVVIAWVDVVSLGARRAMAGEAELAGRVASEDGGAALGPVGGEASLPVAALPGWHQAVSSSWSSSLLSGVSAGSGSGSGSGVWGMSLIVPPDAQRPADKAGTLSRSLPDC